MNYYHCLFFHHFVVIIGMFNFFSKQYIIILQTPGTFIDSNFFLLVQKLVEICNCLSLLSSCFYAVFFIREFPINPRSKTYKSPCFLRIHPIVFLQGVRIPRSVFKKMTSSCDTGRRDLVSEDVLYFLFKLRSFIKSDG